MSSRDIITRKYESRPLMNQVLFPISNIKGIKVFQTQFQTQYQIVSF